MATRGRQIVVEFLGQDRSLSKTANQAERTTSRLGGKLGKVGLVAGAAFAGGVTAAAGALVVMAKNAAEDEAMQRRLAVALKNTAGATDTQIAGVEKWISAQGKALGVTDDQLRPAFQRLVQATGDVGKAQKLAGIAMDASAGSGKSLETVSTAIAKAQNGNMGALSRLGVQIKDANGKTLSFNEAMQEMSKTFGGQAQARANSFEGQMARLSLIFDETKEAIGAKLLPIATKLGEWFLSKGLPAMSKFGKFLQAKLGPIFAKVSGFFRKFGKDGEATTGKFGKTIAELKGIFGSLVSIVKSVVSIIVSLWKKFGGTITSFAVSTFKSLVSIIGGALKVIQGVFKVFASLLKGDWKGAWDGIKLIVSGAWQVIKGIVSAGWATIKAIFSVAGTALKSIFGGIWNGIKSAAKSGFSFIVDGIKAIPGKISALGSKFLSVGKEIIGKFIDGLSRVGGFAKDFASGVWEALKRLINSGIDKINAALEFTIKLPGAIPDVHVNPKNIPHLYRGGIIPGSREGTAVIAGDRGRAEAIVPLSGPNAPSFGGGDINLTVYLDSEVVHRSLVRRKRTLGRPLGLS